MATPIFKYEIVQQYAVPDGYAGKYRKGKPEGIVYHESGNPNNTGANALDQELKYMIANFKKAFTQAWAGHDRIVEIANTDYPCWGAGPKANPRFIQIEIPRYKDKNLLLKAFDRQAFWGAVQLWHYGLPCNNDTLWTHHDVTKYLGGTDHVDPTWLLSQIGKDQNFLFAVTKQYYDVLKAGGDTRKVAGFTKATVGTTTKPQSNNKDTGAKTTTQKSYKETGTFYPNTTIIVRDQPSTKGKIIARYYKGENVPYHTVHKTNGYVWLQYDRSNGGQGYIPCREWRGGNNYGELWGVIK